MATLRQVGEPLLSAKLHAPQPAARRLVERTRLVARLDALLDHRLTVVSAPPGFGKTTLVASWLPRARRRDIPLAWLSLDAGDDDPVRFCRYVAEALRRALPALDPGALPFLTGGPSVEPRALLAPLTNALADLPGDAVLVLDDYHAIAGTSTHDALAFLIEAAGTALHAVLLTRSQPPLPLARLRARGELLELGATDLRFTAEEAAAFLRDTMDLRLGPADVAALEERTEGWAAGLQLAGLALRGEDDPAGAIASFRGTHAYVLDYLTDEVLRRQPEDVQTFLLRTSILERLSGPLCDAVSGQRVGGETLERLERDNVFLVPLDNERRWYRYHHLFADLLRHKLRQATPGIVAELHLRAAEWCEREGLVVDAVDHALAAADYPLAARLVGRAAAAVLLRGELATLLRWMKALPEDVARADPLACLAYAWPLAITGRRDLSRDWLDGVDHVARNLSATARGAVLGEVAAVRAFIAYIEGDIPTLVGQAGRALDLLPDTNAAIRGIVAWQLAQAYRLQGDAVAAERAFGEAARLNDEAGNVWFALLATSNMADRQIERGRLRQGAATHRALQRRAAGGNATSPALATSCNHLADVLREWNDLAQARPLAERAVSLSRSALLYEDEANALITLARIRGAQGDDIAALALLTEADTAAHAYRAPLHIARVAAWRARLALHTGDVESAHGWAQASDLRPDDEPSYAREDAYATLARVLMAAGDTDGALRLLAALESSARRGGRTARVVETLALRALAQAAEREPAPAERALAEALRLGEPEGFVRTFADEGAPMAALLRRARAHGERPDYVAHLLAACERGAAPSPMSGASPAAIVPPPDAVAIDRLTARELEVLRLVAAGASNQEIAERLVLALGTVKKHLTAIFDKLGVSSRTQLIVRARALGLA